MTTQFHIEVEGIDAIRASLAHLKDGMPKAIRRASKRAATAGRKEMVKDVTKIVRIKSGDVKKQTEIKRQGDGQEVTVSAAQRFPLKYFNPKVSARTKGTKKKAGRAGGLRYKIEKGGASKVIEGGFIVKKLSDHAFKRKGKSRLPIQKLHGPSVVAVMVKHKVDDKYIKVFTEKFKERLIHEANYLIKHRYAQRHKAKNA